MPKLLDVPKVLSKNPKLPLKESVPGRTSKSNREPDLIQLLCPTRRWRSFPPRISHKLHTPSVPPVATRPVPKSWSKHSTGPACLPNKATHLLLRRSHMRTLQSYEPERACCPWINFTQLTCRRKSVLVLSHLQPVCQLTEHNLSVTGWQVTVHNLRVTRWA